MVLVDGYLTAVEGFTVDMSTPAFAILELYRHLGDGFARRLSGSYTGMVVDRARGRAMIFNDRRASRPCFLRAAADGSLLIAPETRLLAEIDGGHDSLDHQGVIEQLIFGSYYEDSTIFKDIRRLAPGRLLELSPDHSTESRYWALRFTRQRAGCNNQDLVEECSVLVRQAVRRHLDRVPNCVLLLSGGTDSRLILGAILAEGLEIRAACYGTGLGDDTLVAQKVARHTGILLQHFHISTENASADFLPTALESDCRAESIDSPSLRHLHEQLSQSFDGYINGDECFGWKSATTVEDAFRVVGLHRLPQVDRLRGWINSRFHADLVDQIDARRYVLMKTAECPDPGDLKDWLYYYSRLGNMLNSYTGGKLRYYEQVRPLLDESLIEFSSTLPTNLRNDKFLLRETFRHAYPDLQAIGFTSTDSLPTAEQYQSMLPGNAKLKLTFHQELLEGLVPSLSRLFEEAALGESIRCLIEGRAQPPAFVPWWAQFPGMWRLQKKTENRVHIMTLALRLLQIQLFLGSFRGSGASASS